MARQYGVKLPHFSFPSSFTCFPRHLWVMPLLFFDGTPVVVCALWYMSVRFFLLFVRVCVRARSRVEIWLFCREGHVLTVNACFTLTMCILREQMLRALLVIVLSSSFCHAVLSSV